MDIGTDQENPGDLSSVESANNVTHLQNQDEMGVKKELVCHHADGSQRNDDQGGESCDGSDTTDKPCHVNTRICPTIIEYIYHGK